MKVLALTGRGRALALGAGMVLAAFLSGCGDSPADTATPVTAPSFTLSGTVAKVVVTPSTASLLVGGKTTLVATAYDASGNVVTGGTFDWWSKNTAVATVSNGAVTAVAAGTATINASLGGYGGNATITVTTSSTSTATAASVTVSPTTASVAVGGTTQLTATAKDASGNVLTGRPTTWSSSAPGIATVSSTGLVTGVAAGSATVTVTVDSKTATSAITVTTATAAPPPTSLGVFFADGFEAGYAPKQNNAGWTNTAPSNVVVSTDVAHSGSHSLRFTFPGKLDCNDASAQQAFTLGRQLPEVWIEYYVYFPKGGEGGSASYYHRPQNMCSNTATNNKFITVYGPKYNGETTMSLQTWTTTVSAVGDSRVNTAYSLAGHGGVWFYAAGKDPFVSGVDRGQWMQIRVHLHVATFGQSNGLIQVYKNGTLILSNTTLSWYDSTNTANYLTQGYLMGWSNSGFSQTTHIYIDDVKFIDTYPGW